ncbi:MAG: hypothetical protein ABIJ26_05965 [Candidatus Margulisiibacteriota bacterium]
MSTIFYALATLGYFNLLNASPKLTKADESKKAMSNESKTEAGVY